MDQTTLFRHYKGRYYKFKGIVRHSETLEELVLYECLYPNDLGTLWVRPRAMFFERLASEGPLRFTPIKPDLRVANPGTTEWSDMLDLARLIFGDIDADKVSKRLESKSDVHAVVAYFDGKPAGYKAGYRASDESVFYSWLGGVHSGFRGRGIGQVLLEEQLQWCRAKGYKTLRTKTMNRWRQMLLLNIKKGFDIVATEISSSNDVKIVMELQL